MTLLNKLAPKLNYFIILIFLALLNSGFVFLAEGLIQCYKYSDNWDWNKCRVRKRGFFMMAYA